MGVSMKTRNYSESLLPTLPRQKNKIASQFSTLFLAFHGVTRLEYSATCRVQKCSNFSSNFRFPLQKIPLQQCHTAELVHFIGFQTIRSKVLIKDKASTRFALRDPFSPNRRSNVYQAEIPPNLKTMNTIQTSTE